MLPQLHVFILHLFKYYSTDSYSFLTTLKIVRYCFLMMYLLLSDVIVSLLNLEFSKLISLCIYEFFIHAIIPHLI